jgi:peptide/nickel transport system substrate-binding protein
MDAATFPTGACQYYSNVYFKGGSSYKGMYTDPGSKFNGHQGQAANTITITMAKPFPDMPYWGTFPANGPSRGQGLGPEDLQEPPVVDRSVHDQVVQPVQGAGAGEEPVLGPATDPARTQYPDGYDFKLQQQSEKIDQIMLADSGTGQTTLTYDDLLAP